MAREERGVEGMDRTLSNPHQDEIDAVGTFFEVEQQLAALQASPAQVPMLQPVCAACLVIMHADLVCLTAGLRCAIACEQCAT